MHAFKRRCARTYMRVCVCVCIRIYARVRIHVLPTSDILRECRSSLSYVTVRGTRGGAHRPCSFCSCNTVSPGMESRPERQTSCVISWDLFSLLSSSLPASDAGLLLFARPGTTTIPSRRKTAIVLSPLNRILTAYLILSAIVRCNFISLVWGLKKKKKIEGERRENIWNINIFETWREIQF